MAFATTPWWSRATIAVVTGSNKGIGFEIARLLAKEGLSVIVTARKEELGKAAVEKIAEACGGKCHLDFHTLDVTKPESICQLASWLREKHGGLNILVNNAGIIVKGDISGGLIGPNEAQLTLDTNFFGAAAVTEALLPLMKSNSRIINVCSRIGTTSLVNESLRQRFVSATSFDQLKDLAHEFVRDIREGKHRERGWPMSMYGVSKLCELMYTRLLAKELKDKGITVNAMCPGYCATDLTTWKGLRSAEEGADTAVWLALQDEDQWKTGGFYGERQLQEV